MAFAGGLRRRRRLTAAADSGPSNFSCKERKEEGGWWWWVWIGIYRNVIGSLLHEKSGKKEDSESEREWERESNSAPIMAKHVLPSDVRAAKGERRAEAKRKLEGEISVGEVKKEADWKTGEGGSKLNKHRQYWNKNGVCFSFRECNVNTHR